MSNQNARRRGYELTMNVADAQNLRFIRLHLDWVRRSGASTATIAQRRLVITRLANALAVPLVEATPADLDTWQSQLTVSLSSVRTYTANVRTFYRWMLDAGHLDVDQAARLPLPRLPQRVARPIPDRDLRTAIDCAREPVRTFLVLAAFMGLRAMEIAGIRQENVTEVDGRLLLSGIGKGRKAFRMPVPVEVAPWLRRHLSGSPGPLFRYDTGRVMTPRDVSHETSVMFREIGMPYTLHWCRHSFGTRFYAATRDLLLTQDVMRHSNPTTTRLYVETSSAHATEAMDRLSKSLAPRKPRRPKPPEPPAAPAAA